MKTTFALPRMDCAAEGRLVRMALGRRTGVAESRQTISGYHTFRAPQADRLDRVQNEVLKRVHVAGG